MRRRILIFEPYMFDQMYGNLRYLASIARWHDKAEFELRIVSPRETQFCAVLRDHGVPVDILTPPNALNVHGRKLMSGVVLRIKAAIAMVAYTAALLRYIRAGGFDVIQCHSIRALMTAGWAARLSGRPSIWYVKGHLYNAVLDRIGLFLASRILFQGATNRDRLYPFLRSLRQSSIGIVGNGIELDEVVAAEGRDQSRLRMELALRSDKINIVVVAQVAPNKGLIYLLKALSLARSREKLSLYIVGDHGLSAHASLKSELEAFAASHFLEVKFLGWRADVYDIISVMDAMALPSLEEGVPKSVIEAMALGKPVIVTRVGSVPDLVANEETGLLVEARDSGALADALDRLADDDSLRERLGKAARAFAMAHCSIRSNVGALQVEWRRLAARRKGGA